MGAPMVVTAPGSFEECFQRVIQRRRGHVIDRFDRNNWTGGKIGVGELKGTKYGICAAMHPDENIAGLTLDGARELYRRKYWDKLACEVLPYPLNYAVFAAAIVPHFGPTKAALWLQESADVVQDGDVGYVTLKAAKANRDLVLRRFAGIVLLRMTYLPKWQSNGTGWARTIAEVLIEH